MGTTEAKLPRSVRKGPLITVTCECGQRRMLRYGERWQCEGCGRNFDTHEIPLEEYAAIRQKQLRYRMFPLLSGLLLLVAVILYWINGGAFQALIAVAFLIAAWGMFGRPFFRSRYRRKLTENLPTWTIKGE
jgi:Flp pilus assembly protein TadB